MKRTLLALFMLALLTPMVMSTGAGPAQAANDVVTLQNGKPKQPAPTPVPSRASLVRAMKAMATKVVNAKRNPTDIG
jgi:hypothetical protein